MNKILSKIRLKVAEYLNERHPEMCWAELVMWSLGIKTYKATFIENGYLNQSCRGKNPFDAYCGKCAATGRLYRDEPTVEKFLETLKPEISK